MKFIKKYYLYLTLFLFFILLLSSLSYMFLFNKKDEGFIDWKLTPVYRGSGLDNLIYNVTIQNIGNTKAEYVKMFIFQENDLGNFKKGEFTGAGSYAFQPKEAATFEYGVPLINVKSVNELLKVRSSARLEVLWKVDNITKNKIFVLDPNPQP